MKNIHFKFYLLFVLPLAIFACDSSEPTKYVDSASIIFSGKVNQEELNLKKTRIGDQININNIIIMPSADEKGFLTIEFSKEDIDDSFLNEIISDEGFRVEHPFFSDGIELVVSSKSLFINIYSGVVLNFNSAFYVDSTYKVFKNEGVIGVLKESQGDVAYSTNSVLIKEKLSDFFTSIQAGNILHHPETEVTIGEDGSYKITVNSDNLVLPKSYEPKVIQ